MKEFWKDWKKTNELEKGAIKAIKTAEKIILKTLPKKKIISIYVGGSFVRRDMNKWSDLDVWAITSDVKSLKTIKKLKKKYGEKHKPVIGFTGYTITELRRGRKSKQLPVMRTAPSRFTKNINRFRCIYGEDLDTKGFPVREDKEDLGIMVKVFRSLFLPMYKEKKLGFDSIIKQVFWIGDLEFRIKKIAIPLSWRDMVKLTGKNHVLREALRLRLSGTKDKKERLKFIVKIKRYLKEMEKLAK
ncbi:nucleotidyltransferase domain-containing protein [Nanoarchaeota archaeon]